jgi:hypothetical protein
MDVLGLAELFRANRGRRPHLERLQPDHFTNGSALPEWNSISPGGGGSFSGHQRGGGDPRTILRLAPNPLAGFGLAASRQLRRPLRGRLYPPRRSSS